MKNTLVKIMLLTLLVSTFNSAFAAESMYNMFGFMVLGPIRTNSVGADLAYDPWAELVVKELYKDKTLASIDVGHQLKTEYVTQYSGNRTNMTLHMAVRVVGKYGTNKVSLAMLGFTQNSSDSANSLKNSYLPGSIPNLIYSPKAIGVNYGPGGERVSDVLDMSGDGSALKDEIVFIGVQSKYYIYINDVNYAQVNSYIMNNSANFLLTSSCYIVGKPNAIVNRTLQAHGESIAPILSIIDTGSDFNIGINVETNRTAIIYSSPVITGDIWNLEATVNSGDSILRPKGGQGKFYKAVLQPYSDIIVSF